MKRLYSTVILILAFFVPVLAATYKVEDVPNVHVANRSEFVSNPDGILSDAAVARLNSALGKLWQQTSAEVVVVAVGSVDDDIDTFTTELFTKWGVGKSDKDNGLLLVVAKDDRRAAIRTGYGMEGVVPDILAGRIIRNEMAPRFKEGDYDGGVEAAVATVGQLITTPGATEELMSKYENDRGADDFDGDKLFTVWIIVGGLFAVGVILWLLGVLYSTRRYDRYDRYNALKKILIPAMVISFLGLGVPVVSLLLVWLAMRYMRVRRRICPNCHHKMRRLDEATDNQYLTPAQDMEERLDSVDYDVWLCDNCGETDILPFVNMASTYQVCPHCGARASSLRADRVVIRPTERMEGRGVKIYGCRNCGYENQVAYNIPKLAAAPVVIIPGGGHGGGFGGGGFSGGSFGGGMTGGGGASGGW